MFRVTQRGEAVGDAQTIDGVGAIVQGQPPRRYDVYEMWGVREQWNKRTD
jgi:hypothetical protein